MRSNRYLRMNSRVHVLVSALAGAILAVSLADAPPTRVALLVVAIGVGVGIDLDHFLIARMRTGDWAAVRRCLVDPRRAVFRQDEIFRPGQVGTLPRLLSHTVIPGVVVGGAALVGRPVAILTAVILYLHLLVDLYGDNALRGTFPWQDESHQLGGD